MRHLVIALAAVGALLVSGAANAQPRQSRPAPPPAAQPAQPASLPRTVAPPIVWPYPPVALPTGPLAPRVADDPAFHGMHTPRGRVSGSTGYVPLPLGYGYAGYGYAPGLDNASVNAPTPPAVAATGFLRLLVTPATAQVFVDSYFVGAVGDIDAPRTLALEAGPHRIEIRAPQYQRLAVDVRILPNETVTYRGALELSPPPLPVARPAPSPPTTMYVIPNCYVGNVPPRQSRLPSGCDIKQVQVLGPKS
jgi:hypothetical protein